MVMARELLPCILIAMGRDANGLFGGIRDAEVKNLRLDNAFVKTSSDNYNAILAGYAINSIIRNSGVEGVLDSWYFSGGVVGYAKNSDIVNSFARADDTFLVWHYSALWWAIWKVALYLDPPPRVLLLVMMRA